MAAMGSAFGSNADEEEEQDDERLRRWRPASTGAHDGVLRRNKAASKSSDSSDQESGGSDANSVASSAASKLESESEKSDEGEEKSDSASGSGHGESSDEESDGDEDPAEVARRELERKKKKVVVRMEFEPLLSLHEPLAAEMEHPADLFAQAKRKRKAERGERLAIEDAMNTCRSKANAAAEWLTDMGMYECQLPELAQAIGEDVDELRYALIQSRRFTIGDEGLVKKTLLQRLLDAMESDIETMQEVLDKLIDSDGDSVRAAVADSKGELRLKTANDIELIEHVDLEADQRLKQEHEREERHKTKEEKRKAMAKKSRKRGAEEEEVAESESESSEDEGGVGGMNREAEKKALAFRRVQVQRKIEEFLKMYTKGQHLTKINDKGKRFHRRVYIDTTRKSLVVQGANGPKFFPFASMKEVDIETRTTKEGRVETLVICAIEKRGRIVKELNLSFPDQARANTFVNCVTLFSLALRSGGGGK